MNKLYNERLFRQQLKQQEFLSTSDADSQFTAPSILKLEHPASSGLSSFDMEYIHGEKYSEFLESVPVTQLHKIISDFIAFLDGEIDNAVFEEPNPGIIRKKIRSLSYEIRRKKTGMGIFLEKLDELESSIPDESLPMGFCHGDFTLSNMIFSNGRVYLMDFLDSFIESPVMDIVKLRQDTKFHWSLAIEDDLGNHQIGKIKQVLKYFDDQIVGHFCRRDFFTIWYDFLETINLLRIVPYLSKKREFDFIANCICL